MTAAYFSKVQGYNGACWEYDCSVGRCILITPLLCSLLASDTLCDAHEARGIDANGIDTVGNDDRHQIQIITYRIRA